MQRGCPIWEADNTQCNRKLFGLCKTRKWHLYTCQKIKLRCLLVEAHLIENGLIYTNLPLQYIVCGTNFIIKSNYFKLKNQVS